MTLGKTFIFYATSDVIQIEKKNNYRENVNISFIPKIQKSVDAYPRKLFKKMKIEKEETYHNNDNYKL